jgi:predicted nucleotidyltransferase
MSKLAYPTLQHEQAAQQTVDFFAHAGGVDAVLLVNSCARGKATRDSCLDIIVLVSPSVRDTGNDSTVLERAENKATDPLYRSWDAHPQTQAVKSALSSAGRFAEIHLDLVDGTIIPRALDRDEGLDDFEIAIGNYFAYSQPLWVG